MSYPLIELFANRVLLASPLSDQEGSTSSNGPDNPITNSLKHATDESPPPIAPSGDKTETAPDSLVLGVNDGLYELIEQTAALHVRARADTSTTGVSYSTIMDALSIWQSLSEWEPPSEVPSSDCLSVYRCYQSAIFIWLHFTLYPDQTDDAKVQTLIRSGLQDLQDVKDAGIATHLLIPLFFFGLACTTEVDRAAIKEEMAMIEHEAGSVVDVRVYWDLIMQIWEKKDQGIAPCWE